MLEGSLDPATKTITYEGETVSHTRRDTAPGTAFKFHDVVRLIDKDHYFFERREYVGGKEVNRAELTYTRLKNH